MLRRVLEKENISVRPSVFAEEKICSSPHSLGVWATTSSLTINSEEITERFSLHGGVRVSVGISIAVPACVHGVEPHPGRNSFKP